MIEIEIKKSNKIDMDSRDLNLEKIEIDTRILNKLQRKINKRR